MVIIGYVKLISNPNKLLFYEKPNTNMRATLLKYMPNILN